MNRRQTLLAMSALCAAAALPTLAFADDALKAAISGAHRSPNEKARDPHRRLPRPRQPRPLQRDRHRRRHDRQCQPHRRQLHQQRRGDGGA